MVVDVGHTVEVPGAISARGVPEYTFNLNLARDVQQALVDAGFTKTVLLITSKAPPQGLFERAFRANKMAANLFHFISWTAWMAGTSPAMTAPLIRPFDGRRL